jgi:hypothetical protein
LSDDSTDTDECEDRTREDTGGEEKENPGGEEKHSDVVETGCRKLLDEIIAKAVPDSSPARGHKRRFFNYHTVPVQPRQLGGKKSASTISFMIWNVASERVVRPGNEVEIMVYTGQCLGEGVYVVGVYTPHIVNDSLLISRRKLYVLTADEQSGALATQEIEEVLEKVVPGCSLGPAKRPDDALLCPSRENTTRWVAHGRDYHMEYVDMVRDAEAHAASEKKGKDGESTPPASELGLGKRVSIQTKLYTEVTSVGSRKSKVGVLLDTVDKSSPPKPVRKRANKRKPPRKTPPKVPAKAAKKENEGVGGENLVGKEVDLTSMDFGSDDYPGDDVDPVPDKSGDGGGSSGGGGGGGGRESGRSGEGEACFSFAQFMSLQKLFLKGTAECIRAGSGNNNKGG